MFLFKLKKKFFENSTIILCVFTVSTTIVHVSDIFGIEANNIKKERITTQRLCKQMQLSPLLNPQGRGFNTKTHHNSNTQVHPTLHYRSFLILAFKSILCQTITTISTRKCRTLLPRAFKYYEIRSFIRNILNLLTRRCDT